jgi:Uma2 family endonuclease
MSVTMFGRARGVWSEAGYLALSETSVKVELFDGDLVMSPPANLEHQDIACALRNHLVKPARAAGLRAHLDPGVRLGKDRIAVPDVAVIEAVSRQHSVVDAAIVRLVAEVTSRGNLRNDRVRKMNYYAAAGIPYYLLIDRYPTLVMRLFRLKDEHFVEEATAVGEQPLRLPAPLDVVIDAAMLLDE